MGAQTQAISGLAGEGVAASVGRASRVACFGGPGNLGGSPKVPPVPWNGDVVTGSVATNASSCCDIPTGDAGDDRQREER